MPPLNPAPKPTVDRVTTTERKARYVIEILSAVRVSHFLTTADWTDSERDVAMAGILRLLGHGKYWAENPPWSEIQQATWST